MLNMLYVVNSAAQANIYFQMENILRLNLQMPKKTYMKGQENTYSPERTEHISCEQPLTLLSIPKTKISQVYCITATETRDLLETVFPMRLPLSPFNYCKLFWMESVI